jgi:hypothetical protein
MNGGGPTIGPGGPHPAGTNIDLGRVLPLGSRVTVEPEEHDADRAARLKIEERAALIKDIKEVAVFAVVLLFVVGAGLVCGYIAFMSTTATPDQAKYAQTVFTALVSGGSGLLFGKAISK